MRDQSQIEDMRAAIRGDIERSRARRAQAAGLELASPPAEEPKPAVPVPPLVAAEPEPAEPAAAVEPEAPVETDVRSQPEPVVEPEPEFAAEPEPVVEPEPAAELGLLGRLAALFRRS